MKPGIHLLHKPVGPTSFSLVQACLEAVRAGAGAGAGGGAAPGRRPPRVCHGGTLDPFASGLLLILVEPATRLFDYLHAVPKVYEATVRWGIETDNGDLHGREVFAGDPAGLTPARLDEALTGFTGWQEQVPPATSAKRVDGERAYVRAHRGEKVVMPALRVYLHEARWIDHDLPRASRLKLMVRGGYYVRSLARDLGRLLGCGAHLTALHRSSIGPWSDPGPGRQVEIGGKYTLPWASGRTLSDQEVGDLRQGGTIAQGELLPPGWALPSGFPDPQAPVRGFHRERFIFLLAREEGRLRLLAPLRGGM